MKKKWSLPNALKWNWPLGLASSPELFIRCWYCGINAASGWIQMIKFTVVKLTVLSNSNCLISCTSELNLTFVTYPNHIALPVTKNAQFHPEFYEHPSRESIQFSGIMFDSYGQRYSFLDINLAIQQLFLSSRNIFLGFHTFLSMTPSIIFTEQFN